MNIYEIDVDAVLKQSRELSDASRRLKSVFNFFDPDLSCLGDSGQSVRDKLVILRDSIGCDIKHLTALGDTVENVAEEYKWSEELVLAKMQGKMIYPIGSGRLTIERGAHEEEYKTKAVSKGKVIGYDSLRNHYRYDDKTKKWKKYDPLKEKRKKENKQRKENGEGGILDKFKSAVDLDVKVYGKEYTDEISVSQWSYIDGDPDGTHSSGSFKVGNFARTAGFYLGPLSGMYIGTSVTALHWDHEEQWGDENFAGYLQSEVNVGKAEANAEVAIGTKNGKAHALAEFSAEALGGEAAIKGGVKTDVVDIGVKASVNYGFGVKAKFGLDEGVFKAEFGASLGIGGGIAIEVDFSKLTENVVVKKAASLVADTGKFARDVSNGVGKVFGSAGKALSGLGKGIGRLFK